MSKIFVTGGAGFIGSHLVKKLVSLGHEVIVADVMLRGNKIDPAIMNSIQFHKADVRDKATMLELTRGCELIFHFAAVLGVDVVADAPVETMDTEVQGMFNLIDACQTHGIKKMVYASTSGIYGHSAIEKSATETITVDPRTSYAIAKRFNEIYLAACFEEKGIESVSLRLFNVYGKGQDNRMVIPRFIEQAKSGEPITVFGSGDQTRDFTYIDDTIEACIRLSQHIHGAEIYNISNEEEVKIVDLAKKIVKISGSKSQIKNIDAPSKRYDYEVERRLGSSEKLFGVTGFKPKTPLETGLKTIISE